MLKEKDRPQQRPEGGNHGHEYVKVEKGKEATGTKDGGKHYPDGNEN